jgi:hypothetical protein
MWDGREPSLESQSVDATLGHAQATGAPTAAQQTQIVDFETGLFTAQSRDDEAGNLSSDGAFGGPDKLRTFLPQSYVGINDPVPNGTPPQFGNRGPNGNGNPIPFSPVIFEEYKAWANLAGDPDTVERRRRIARGEQIFNSVPMTIARVTGINDTLNIPSFSGNCGTCHDTFNVGNHSRKTADQYRYRQWRPQQRQSEPRYRRFAGVQHHMRGRRSAPRQDLRRH